MKPNIEPIYDNEDGDGKPWTIGVELGLQGRREYIMAPRPDGRELDHWWTSRRATLPFCATLNAMTEDRMRVHFPEFWQPR